MSTLKEYSLLGSTSNNALECSPNHTIKFKSINHSPIAQLYYLMLLNIGERVIKYPLVGG